ncbi:MAG: hypothetical protein HY023_01265 [Chloroflexi bacterium]|nr:hypothetical protein [Chloroflexota bacterium]
MSFAKRHKFALQLIAFLAVMLPSIGLFYSATARAGSVTWLLVGVVAGGMVIAVNCGERRQG